MNRAEDKGRPPRPPSEAPYEKLHSQLASTSLRAYLQMLAVTFSSSCVRPCLRYFLWVALGFR